MNTGFEVSMTVDDPSQRSRLIVSPKGRAAGNTLVWKLPIFQVDNDKLALVSSQVRSFILVHIKSYLKSMTITFTGQLVAAYVT